MGFLTMLRNEKKNRETTLRIPMSHLEEYHAEPSYMNDAEMEEYIVGKVHDAGYEWDERGNIVKGRSWFEDLFFGDGR